MPRKLLMTLAAGAALAAAPAPASAHISLTRFTIAPACAAPGSPVAYDVAVNQSHWYHVHTLWARVTVTHALTGLVLFQEDKGPEYVPVGNYSSNGTQVIPANAPPGDYSVALALGSGRGGSNWGAATRTLRVRPLGICIV